MVDIGRLTATGAEPRVIPHLPGGSTAAATISFIKSLEGRIDRRDKGTVPEELPAGMVGTKATMLRIRLRVVGNATAGVTQAPTELKRTDVEQQLSLSRGAKTSTQEIVAGSEKEDLIQGGSVVAAEDVPLNPKVRPVQKPAAEDSLASARQKVCTEESTTSRVRKLRTETASKAKGGRGKNDVSSDAPVANGGSKDTKMMPDPFALSRAGQSLEPAVAVTIPSSIVQSVQNLKDMVETPDASATGKPAVRAKASFHGLKVPASAKENAAATGSEACSGKTTLEDDGARDKDCHADDSSRLSPHETSAAVSDGTSGREVQSIPLTPFMNEQVHVLSRSSPRSEVSVSGRSHANMRAEAFDQPVASVGEHRALAASPTMLEIGVSGGSHGWLKIRAELAGDGAVHASVLSSSTVGAETLRRELPSLTTYLRHEQVALGSIVVHTSAGTHESFGMSSGFESPAGKQQQADAHQRRSQQDGGTNREWNERPWSDGMYEDGIAWQPQAISAGGGWLSVRA